MREDCNLNLKNEKPLNLKRTRLEIISGILEFCGEPKLPTNIMYKTNLGHKALKTYIATLCSLGLLGQSSRKYVTTEKGRQFVQSFANLENMLGKSDSTLKHDNNKLKTS